MNIGYDPQVIPWEIDERNFPSDGNSEYRLKFLIGYARLAPSSHNTQPWKFAVKGNEIRLFADTVRWLKVADADQRELYVSLGCALENLLIAAEHFGFQHHVAYFPEPGHDTLVAAIVLHPSEPSPNAFRDPALFRAISARHTNRRAYNGQPIPPSDLTRLQRCSVEDGIVLDMTDHAAIKRRVDEMMIEADALQFANPAFREELGYWMGQGAFGASWLLARIAQLAVTYLNLGQSVARKDSEVLLSASVLAVISSHRNDRLAQVLAGQVFERVFLMATALGIRLQPMNQILQVPEIKAKVTALMPTPGLRPQIAFRLGYAEPEHERSPRRPLEEVLL
jgi:nitroreductase